jgi:hypothetical protein
MIELADEINVELVVDERAPVLLEVADTPLHIANAGVETGHWPRVARGWHRTIVRSWHPIRTTLTVRPVIVV